MELRDQFKVSASMDEAWSFFWDLPRVAKCLPGCESVEVIGDTTFRARIVQRVGPFSVAMDVDIELDEIEEGKRIVVSGAGKDRMGNRLRLNRLAMQLQEVGSSSTEVTYELDFNLFGRLATLGNTVVKRKAEETREEFSRRIAAELGS